jgi:alkyl hydroperoxide reductase subunit D
MGEAGADHPLLETEMSIETVKNALPEYARDLKINLSGLTKDPALTTQQTYGALLAAALSSRHPQVIRAVFAEAKEHLSAEAITAAKAAAAIMGMNNIYYRFTHLVSDKDYATLPARLRMNVMANPGVDKVDFELWSLVVSAVNGCGMCMDSHEKVLRKAGASKEAVQQAIRVASVVHAVAVALEAEESLAA